MGIIELDFSEILAIAAGAMLVGIVIALTFACLVGFMVERYSKEIVKKINESLKQNSENKKTQSEDCEIYIKDLTE